MGTGGATALGSPECGTALAFRCFAGTQARGRISGDKSGDWRQSTVPKFQKEQSAISCCRSADIYIQEFISAEDSRRYNRVSFCFEIICSSLWAFAVLSHGEGLTEK